MSLADELGFYVEDGHVKSTERRKDMADNIVAATVRPATPQEIKMYDMLVEIGETHGR